DSVYKVIELVGSSETSWEEAARHAIETAAEHVRELRVAEVVSMDLKVEEGKVVSYRTKINASFKYEGHPQEGLQGRSRGAQRGWGSERGERSRRKTREREPCWEHGARPCAAFWECAEQKAHKVYRSCKEQRDDPGQVPGFFVWPQGGVGK
ncbi:MAG: dodecin family protein, partial [Chromatiaceae bacterium]